MRSWRTRSQRRQPRTRASLPSTAPSSLAWRAPTPFCATYVRAAPLRCRPRALTLAASQIAFHSQRAPSPPLPATVAYAKRLAEVAASKPLLLVAYAQTLYVALLAGGQTMATIMRTSRGLVRGEGDAIFDFCAAIPAAEHHLFRAALREAVDALGESLTGVQRAASVVLACLCPD